MQWLTALAQRSRAERLLALTTILDDLQLPYDTDVHDTYDGRSLTNVIVRVGQGQLVAGFSAHYDAKGGSRGAVDNGSGVAALLELARELSEQQLDRQFVLYFFDLEEEGGTGSQAFVGNNPNTLPPVVFNLDMCGYGDTLTVGPTEAASGQHLEQLRDAAITAQTELEEFSYALGGSDHESFLEASIPAFLITLLPRDEVTLLRNIFEDEDYSEIPSIFTIKDSQQDYLGRIQPRSVERCVEFLLALTTS